MNDLESYKVIRFYSEKDMEQKLNSIEGKFDIVSCYSATVSTSIIHFVVLRFENPLYEAPPLPEPDEDNFT